jgi:secreted trypsin-like serine protease
VRTIVKSFTTNLATTVTTLVAAIVPAYGIVGQTNAAHSSAASHIVMIVSTRGSLCTGTALAGDLVLTAGHCVAPAASYRVLTSEKKPPGISTAAIVVNPRYNLKDYASGRVTADVAIVKLSSSLPADIKPATLGALSAVTPGEHIIIAGYGSTVYGAESGIGVPRSASLVVTGRPGSLQIRLVDAAGKGSRAGIGACTGDSGGPAFVENAKSLSVIGVISWSTGPNLSEGCGGMTGVTPITLHRSWIIETAKKLGSPIGP